MTITASIIADSISQEGKRLTTFMLRYPRFIHAELMTHRVFSRNASSSRAIPVAKMIDDLRRDPAMPIYWGSSKPGMQAGNELNQSDIKFAKHIWLSGMEDAIGRSQALINLDLHKQIANRILEPWAHINVVVTATEYTNWFALRDHPMAQPEIHELAHQMRLAMDHSNPTLLLPGQWHLPFVEWEGQSDDREAAFEYLQSQSHHGDFFIPHENQFVDIFKMVSTARCARTSYLTHDGRKTTVKEDLELFQKLVVDTPLHASPAEHQATPDILSSAGEGPYGEWRVGHWHMPHQHGNFIGWRQHRKMLPGEYVRG